MELLASITTSLLSILPIFDGLSTEASFWWFFCISVFCFMAYAGFAKENFWLAFGLGIISAGTAFVYFSLDGDPYWFLEWSEDHWLRWIVSLFLTSLFLGVGFRTAWANIRQLGSLFSYPVGALAAFLLGALWLVVTLGALMFLAVTHTFAFLLVFLGAVGTARQADVSGVDPSSDSIEVLGEGTITGRFIEGSNKRSFAGHNGWFYDYDGFKWVRTK